MKWKPAPQSGQPVKAPLISGTEVHFGGQFERKGTGVRWLFLLTSGGGAEAKWQGICLLDCCAMWLLTNLQLLGVGARMEAREGDVGHGLFSG